MIKCRVLNKDALYDYKWACKLTQGIKLEPVEVKKPENETAYWVRQIVANHSTLRFVHFVFEADAPKSVVMQIIRATKGNPQPEVESSRPDWTGKERSSDPYEEKIFGQLHTAESFTAMASQRLCNKTEPRTRAVMLELVKTLLQSPDPFLRAVGLCCKPSCWWHGGCCPEPKCCNENTPKLSDRIFMEEENG